MRESQKRDGGRARVLVVEDEPTVREVFTQSLELAGFEVLEAGDVAAALRLVEELRGSIDLIVVDTHLPDGDGVDFIDRVTQVWPGTRSILTSGSSDEESRATAESRRYPFLAKPFSLDVLIRTARAALE